MQRAISYFDYDRLSDDLLFLGNATVIRLNVALAKADKEQRRIPSHREFLYPTSKYVDKDSVVTLRRSFDYYLSIDKLDERDCSVMIRVQDILLLRAKLQEVSTWFNDGTFGIKKSKLTIVNHREPVVVNGLAEGKYIQFDPVVIEYENTGQQVQGIRLTLVNPNVYVDLSIDRFFGMMYIINTIDMFGYAQNMVNYLGRPDYGTNLTEYSKAFVDEEVRLPQNEPDVKGKDRQLPNQRKRSFFDRIDDMSE